MLRSLKVIESLDESLKYNKSVRIESHWPVALSQPPSFIFVRSSNRAQFTTLCPTIGRSARCSLLAAHCSLLTPQHCPLIFCCFRLIFAVHCLKRFPRHSRPAALRFARDAVADCSCVVCVPSFLGGGGGYGAAMHCMGVDECCARGKQIKGVESGLSSMVHAMGLA